MKVRGGNGRISRVNQTLDGLRAEVQKNTHTLQDVIDKKHSVGVEGGGGADYLRAQEAGLFTTRYNNIPIYATSESAARPLINYLKRGGKYGTVEFSRLLGYTKREIGTYKKFLRMTQKA